eukprot:TRINITY_DN4707_c0_g1_i3.p1 TRINITY_DN4707_c0_g1~~TRINITY_DN4707_c0_g1_i3.p1  ORF type:complete len:128 (+),score=33.45 TRINITY_DN4707_c0_g1_i3:143-526(+)
MGRSARARRQDSFSLDALESLFSLPVAEAAKRLGVGLTLFKVICRKNGIQRWPYRKLQSLQNKLTELESHRDEFRAKLLTESGAVDRPLADADGSTPENRESSTTGGDGLSEAQQVRLGHSHTLISD